MNNAVGYLLHQDGSLVGNVGFGYNYVLAHDGVYIRAENEFLAAYIPIANCEVRGLTTCEPCVELRKGKIPGVLFDLALSTALVRKDKEVYFAITWTDKYHLFMTRKEGEKYHVGYDMLDNTVMGLHTHPNMVAQFSGGDDRDEQGLRLDCVIGRLDRDPEVSFRVGVYGYFWPLSWNQIFEGPLNGVKDLSDNSKEVSAIELSTEGGISEDYTGRSWWDRLFGR